MRLLVFTAIFAVIATGCSNDPAHTTNVGDTDIVPGDTDGETYSFTRVDNTTCNLGTAAPSTRWAATDVYTGMSTSSLTGMMPIPNGGGLLALAEQNGRVLVFDPANPSRREALNVVSRVLNGGEKGFLSIAFAPDFDTSGYLYASYAIADSSRADYKDIRIARYHCTRDQGLTCDPASELTVITIDRPSDYDNHNGGQLFFGSTDGMLYISMGDSASSGDPQNWAQDRTKLEGKLLRIDASTTPYNIPDGNPYKGNASGYREEIFAYGLRNPWRCSESAGQIICGDVGQNIYEEIDIIVAGGNYGWVKREANHPYNGGACTSADACIDPIYAYKHESGRQAVTGGFVYRGSKQAPLVGAYVYADYATGEVWRLDDVDGVWTSTFLVNAGGGVSSFGLDADGEIYALHTDGSIAHIELRTDGGRGDFPLTLAATGCFSDIPNQKLVDAALPYALRVPFWSDGAVKTRYVVLPNGETMMGSVNDAWSFPVGTIVIKQFTYADAPIETRFLVQRSEGAWEGYSYKWNDAHTDATLVGDEEIVSYGEHLHVYPSRAECDTCHTAKRGHILGLRTEQVNRGNQIAAMTDALFLSAGLSTSSGNTSDTGAANGLPQLAVTTNPDASLYDRSRSYLAANCTQCHNGDGEGGRFPDMRYQTALADTELCNFITPGSSASSLLIAQRMNVRGEPYGTLGAGQMPPLATLLVDTDGVALVSAWIDAMDDGTMPAAHSCLQN